MENQTKQPNWRPDQIETFRRIAVSRCAISRDLLASQPFQQVFALANLLARSSKWLRWWRKHWQTPVEFIAMMNDYANTLNAQSNEIVIALQSEDPEPKKQPVAKKRPARRKK